MEKYYADGYHLQMGLTDLEILFTRRGDEQVVVTMSVVLAKTLAQQLIEAVRLYEAHLGESVPTAQELEEKFQSRQGEVA
ncbi:MAG: hypothetical protein GXO25_04525 [Euryarchaeota archaeon]|nr:hypothetical protein [Euryarchaeota archaeon]